MSYVGVDVGASFVKVALLDPVAGTLVTRSRRPFPSLVCDRVLGAREGDADAIVAQVRSAIEEAAEGADAVDGVVVCGQMHGVVLTTPEGRAISPFISWQDQRAAGDVFAEVQHRLGDAILATGNELRVGSPVTVLHALRRAGELPDGAIPASLPDFVISALAGHAVRSHPTNAAAHGAWDVANARWHDGTIGELGLDRLRWPDAAADAEVVAHVSIAGREVPVLAALGDQQAALLGVALTPDEVSVNAATGSQVSAIARTPDAGAWQVRPYVDGCFLRTVTHLPAGRALNVLVRLVAELAPDLAEDAVWARIAAAAERATGTRLEVNPAFFEAAVGFPGSITGISEDGFSVGHLFRATFDRMARNYAEAARRIGVDPARRRVVLSGGLVQRMPPLQEAIVARFAAGTRHEPDLDATLRGLLALARVHRGLDARAMDAASRMIAERSPDAR